MFEAAAYPAGFAHSARSTTQSFNATANYMLVATDHFDDSATVRRISFASSVVEHVLRLWAHDYKEKEVNRWPKKRCLVDSKAERAAAFAWRLSVPCSGLVTPVASKAVLRLLCMMEKAPA